MEATLRLLFQEERIVYLEILVHVGPIILNYAPGKSFGWHFYARRSGQILSVPGKNKIFKLLKLQNISHQSGTLILSRQLSSGPYINYANFANTVTVDH